MKRSIERWQICRPEAMITDQSEAAAIFAMEDARHDILELYDELKRMKSLLKMAAYPARGDELKRMKSLLKMAAYPARGTDENSLDIYEFAKIVQSVYSLADLEVQA